MGSPIIKGRLAVLLLLAVGLPFSNLIARSQVSSIERSSWFSPQVFNTLTFVQREAMCSSLDDTFRVIPAGKEEQYFELGCTVNNFSGYFDPSRWVSCDYSGDSGVDVTGAPIPKLLVEGTNRDLIEVANKRCEQFSIIIPANGYISFEWDVLGSSISQHPTATSFLSFFINEKTIHLPANQVDFTAPYLHQGDRITFQLASDNTSDLVIRHFEFMSNAMGVIERNWYSDLNTLNRQFIPIENTSISNVVIPAVVEITLSDFAELERLTQPYLVGQPYLDQDGNEDTQEDQVNLLEVKTTLDLSWEDAISYDDNGDVVIIREWSVYDGCAGNQIHQQQLIYCRPKWSYDE